MYTIDTTSLSHLADFSNNIKFNGTVPAEETVKKIINKFQSISSLDLENYDFYKLEEEFEFSYIEFSNEDAPYRHKVLGVAIIILLSSNYSDQLVRGLLDFVVGSMKSLAYATVLKYILWSIFPNFKPNINKIIDDFVKNKK